MKMRRFTLTLLSYLVCMTSFAYDVKIDGLYYNLNKNDFTAIVTYESVQSFSDGIPPYDANSIFMTNNDASGDINIPEQIIVCDTSYTVTRIAESAFYRCEGITSVSIPSSISTVGQSAFYGCSNLISLEIHDGVQNIGSLAFMGCPIKTIDLPSSIKLLSTGYVGIFSWSSIEKLYIHPLGIINRKFLTWNDSDIIDNPNAILYVPASEYQDYIESDYWKGFGTIVCLPETVTETGVIENNGILYQVNVLENIATVINRKSVKYEGDIVIPEKVSVGQKECKVTGIGEKAFSDCSNLTSITLPEGIKTIGEYAFQGCSRLYSITLPEGITSIGANAFIRSGLKSVNIPSTVSTIEQRTFYGCYLQTVIIHEGTKSIKEEVFRPYAPTNLTMPSSLTDIANNAFSSYIHNLTIEISDLEEWIKNGRTLGSDNCQLIKDGKEIKELLIPNSVTSLRTNIFNNCTGLISIHIPESVTNIESSAFYGCSGLSSITIPSSVTNIDHSAFRGCSSLNSIVIPESVTSIGSGAFMGCSTLTSVTIPSSVINLGESAFYGCTSLVSVTSHMVAPPIIDENTFPTTFKTQGTLYIPAGTRSIYSEKGWGQYFLNIVEMEEGEPIWLSIIDQEQGRTDIRCKVGQTYTFRFNAPEGRRIQSVVFRGANVTDWLTEDGEFTTPAMSKSAELIVTYDSSSAPAKGDLNGDGKITIADVTALVNAILGK